MNINYIKNTLMPMREAEIKDGKNLCTSYPIYVVLDLQENIVSGHSEYSPSTNYKGKGFEFGYVDMDLDCECREFMPTDDNMSSPEEITRFWTDRIIAFFLTSEGAHNYLIYQSYNLSSDAYVYVFNAGYGNREMFSLFDSI